MPRPEKVQAVADIKERIDGAQAVFLTEYRGLSVKAQQTLRRSLRASGAEYKVVKMSLAQIAATELGYTEVASEMVGPTAIAFANTDAVATAKALSDFAKEHDAFVLKAGILTGQYLAPEQVSALAALPSRDQLLGKIAGAMKAPLYGAAGLFAGFARASASMFSQLLEKKEAGDPVAGVGGTAAPADTPTPDPEPDPEPEAAAEVEEPEAKVEADTEVAADDEPPADAAPTDEAPETEPEAEAAATDTDAPVASETDDDSEEE